MSEVREQASREHVVGLASELPPGKHRVVRIRSLEVGIYNIGGTFYALHSMCPHQFGPVCAGPVGTAATHDDDWRLKLERDGEILTCPWHGMEFEIRTGQCLSKKNMKLRMFPVRVVDGEVRVELGGRRTSAAA